MKRILAIILLVILLCFTLIGCTRNINTERIEQNDNRFAVIFNDGFAIVYVDKTTGVQYFSRANCGTCVVVDADGKPLIYEGE